MGKSVTVTCNDPQQPTVILQLKGTVWKPVDINPTYSIFNVVADAETNETRVVRITSHLDEPLTITSVECTNKAFKTELKTLKEGKEFELHVTAVPPFRGSTIQSPILLKTSSAQSSLLTVNAIIVVRESVSVTPQQISLPPGTLKEPRRFSIFIRNNGPTSMTLTDPEVSLPGADARVEELQPGKMFNLVVSFPVGFEWAADAKGEATVKTSHPQYPHVRVAILPLALPAGGPPILRSPAAQLLPSLAAPLPSPPKP
jgi:hypothetical protein